MRYELATSAPKESLFQMSAVKVVTTVLVGYFVANLFCNRVYINCRLCSSSSEVGECFACGTEKTERNLCGFCDGIAWRHWNKTTAHDSRRFWWHSKRKPPNSHPDINLRQLISKTVNFDRFAWGHRNSLLKSFFHDSWLIIPMEFKDRLSPVWFIIFCITKKLSWTLCLGN